MNKILLLLGIATIAVRTLATAKEEQELPVGAVLPQTGNKVPGGWLVCDGRSLSITQYPELYSTIGNRFTTESIQSTTQFQLPDLRGRSPIGAGLGRYGLGTYVGVEKHSFSVNEMPPHDHNVVDDLGHSHVFNYSEPSTADWFYDYALIHWRQGEYFTLHKHPSESDKAWTNIKIKDAGLSRPHENVPPSAVVNFIINAGKYISHEPITTTPTPIPNMKPWPKHQDLLGIWPLNSQYQFSDISGNQNVVRTASSGFTRGPFSVPNSAITPVNSSKALLEVQNAKLSVVKSSFTVALFFTKSVIGVDSGSQSGGIFEFIDSYNSTKSFQFHYFNRTTIEVSANGKTVGNYAMIQQKGVWTFIAVTFDVADKMCSVYSKHGLVGRIPSSSDIDVSNTFNNNGIRLGYSSRWSQALGSTAAVSCLIVYRTSLTAKEVRQLYDACRVLHGAAPCGTPKVSLPPIPKSTVVTKMSKPGQFPFVALVRRNGEPVCSATIIDEYWLLTSSTCFIANQTPSLLTIHIGVYDYNTYTEYSLVHSVAKLIIESNTSIALIEVTEPIDFSNLHVNDVCLFRYDEVDDLQFDSPQYVFGWGVHGRQPLISRSLGRYVPGGILTEKQCRQSWGLEDYVATNDLCFLSTSVDTNVPCAGDEGSPLLVKAFPRPTKGLRDRLVQVGVYRKRDANCSPDEPALFTNVAVYNTWIAEQIACAVPGVLYPKSCPQR